MSVEVDTNRNIMQVQKVMDKLRSRYEKANKGLISLKKQINKNKKINLAGVYTYSPLMVIRQSFRAYL